ATEAVLAGVTGLARSGCEVPSHLEQATLRRVRLLAAAEEEGSVARRWWAGFRIPALAFATAAVAIVAVELTRGAGDRRAAPGGRPRRSGGPRAAAGGSSVAGAQPGGATTGLGELPALPAAPGAQAAVARRALPAIPGIAAAGAGAAAAELRDLPRLRSWTAAGVRPEVPPLEVRSASIPVAISGAGQAPLRAG